MSMLGRFAGAGAVIAAFCLVWGGCATKVKVVAADPALAGQLGATPIVAVGPVTVAPAVGAMLAPADAADAATALQRALLAARPDLEVWPLAAVEERCAAGELERLAGEYGRLGRLRADQLAPLAEALAGCRLLALARVIEDDVRSITQRLDTPEPAARPIESGEPGGFANLSVSTERRVTVALEIFDLVAGRSLWRAEAQARERERYRYEDRLRRDPTGYVQQRLAASDSPVLLDRRGEYLQLPDLIALMQQALTAMAERLPAAGR